MLIGAHWLDIGFACIGGILLSFSSTLNLYMNGALTGMSGNMFNAISYKNFGTVSNQRGMSLISGMMISSAIMFFIQGFDAVNGTTPFFDIPEIMIHDLSLTGFAISGLLVGFGTKLGNGCTSGHGICGLPRFSPRSFVAVISFMITGFTFANIRYYAHFFYGPQALNNTKNINFNIGQGIMLGLFTALFIGIIVKCKHDATLVRQNVVGFIVGLIFGFGLLIGGMARRTKILNFLAFSSNWDPSLMFILCVGVGLNVVTFHYIIKKGKKSQYCSKLDIPTNKTIDLKLIIGEAIFGIGWGIGELCPGPSMLLFGFMTPHVTALFIPMFVVGQYAAYFLEVNFLNEVSQKAKENQLNTSGQSQQQLLH